MTETSSPTSSLGIARSSLTVFLFSPDTDRWLSVLRLGLAAEVVLYCLSLRNQWTSLLSGNGAGLLDRRLPETIVAGQSILIPQVNWLVVVTSKLGWSEQNTLDVMWIVLLLAGLALMAGLLSRTAAALAWFLHLAAAKSGGLYAYGVDNFMTIGLFYLVLAPHPDRLALDARIWKRREIDPALLGFFRRLLQLHLCVIYFFSGLTKCLGSGWWNGSNLWRALTRPEFGIIPVDWLASVSYLLTPAGIAVCILELAYPIFIWPGRTGRWWLVLICIMHAAIGVSMSMYLFAFVMIVLNLAAFGPQAKKLKAPVAEAVLT